MYAWANVYKTTLVSAMIRFSRPTHLLKIYLQPRGRAERFDLTKSLIRRRIDSVSKGYNGGTYYLTGLLLFDNLTACDSVNK